MSKRRWDANWDRLRPETKADRLRDRLLWLEGKTEQEIRNAGSAANAALYVANLSR